MPRKTPANHTPLLALAKEATEGRWMTDKQGDSIDVITVWQNDAGEHLIICENADVDAEFIAAAHPEKVIELIDEISALRKALADRNKQLVKISGASKSHRTHMQRLNNLARAWRREITNAGGNPGRNAKLMSLENLIRLESS